VLHRQIKPGIHWSNNLYGQHAAYVQYRFYLPHDSLEWLRESPYHLARLRFPSSSAPDRQYWHRSSVHPAAVLPAYTDLAAFLRLYWPAWHRCQPAEGWSHSGHNHRTWSPLLIHSICLAAESDQHFPPGISPLNADQNRGVYKRSARFHTAAIRPVSPHQR